MRSYLISTRDMGLATLTYNARSVSLTYEDGTVAFALNFIVHEELDQQEGDIDSAKILVAHALVHYGVINATAEAIRLFED